MQAITSRTLAITLASFLLGNGCEGRRGSITAPSPPDVDLVTDAALTASPWASTIFGEDGGALYELLMPKTWNGDLIIIVHGLVDPAAPIALPSFPAVVNLMGTEGYAVAFSSFSENGWAIKDGAQRTHALSDIFEQQFGAARRTFLAGQSMGGLIALDLAEQHPRQYAGIFAFCGATGGTTLRYRYMMDMRALFDVFYRSPSGDAPLLPGDALHVDRTGLDLERDIRQVARAAMLANDVGANAIARITRTPVPFASRTEMINAIADQLFRHAREIDDAMMRGHDASAIDNTDVTYSGPGLDDATITMINARVQRFTSTRYAVAVAERYYDPTGDLRIPFMSLRTTRDPALPAPLNDEVYLAMLTQAQRDALVTVRTLDRFGHCSATAVEIMSAFDELAAKAALPPR